MASTKFLVSYYPTILPEEDTPRSPATAPAVPGAGSSTISKPSSSTNRPSASAAPTLAAVRQQVPYLAALSFSKPQLVYQPVTLAHLQGMEGIPTANSAGRGGQDKNKNTVDHSGVEPSTTLPRITLVKENGCFAFHFYETNNNNNNTTTTTTNNNTTSNVVNVSNSSSNPPNANTNNDDTTNHIYSNSNRGNSMNCLTKPEVPDWLNEVGDRVHQNYNSDNSQDEPHANPHASGSTGVRPKDSEEDYWEKQFWRAITEARLHEKKERLAAAKSSTGASPPPAVSPHHTSGSSQRHQRPLPNRYVDDNGRTHSVDDAIKEEFGHADDLELYDDEDEDDLYDFDDFDDDDTMGESGTTGDPSGSRGVAGGGGRRVGPHRATPKGTSGNRHNRNRSNRRLTERSPNKLTALGPSRSNRTNNSLSTPTTTTTTTTVVAAGGNGKRASPNQNTRMWQHSQNSNTNHIHSDHLRSRGFARTPYSRQPSISSSLATPNNNASVDVGCYPQPRGGNSPPPGMGNSVAQRRRFTNCSATSNTSSAGISNTNNNNNNSNNPNTNSSMAANTNGSGGSHNQTKAQRTAKGLLRQARYNEVATVNASGAGSVGNAANSSPPGRYVSPPGPFSKRTAGTSAASSLTATPTAGATNYPQQHAVYRNSLTNTNGIASPPRGGGATATKTTTTTTTTTTATMRCSPNRVESHARVETGDLGSSVNSLGGSAGNNNNNNNTSSSSNNVKVTNDAGGFRFPIPSMRSSAEVPETPITNPGSPPQPLLATKAPPTTMAAPAAARAVPATAATTTTTETGAPQPHIVKRRGSGNADGAAAAAADLERRTGRQRPSSAPPPQGPYAPQAQPLLPRAHSDVIKAEGGKRQASRAGGTSTSATTPAATTAAGPSKKDTEKRQTDTAVPAKDKNGHDANAKAEEKHKPNPATPPPPTTITTTNEDKEQTTEDNGNSSGVPINDTKKTEAHPPPKEAHKGEHRNSNGAAATADPSAQERPSGSRTDVKPREASVSNANKKAAAAPATNAKKEKREKKEKSGNCCSVM